MWVHCAQANMCTHTLVVLARYRRENARNMDTYVTENQGNWFYSASGTSAPWPILAQHGNVLPNTLIRCGTGGLINQRS